MTAAEVLAILRILRPGIKGAMLLFGDGEEIQEEALYDETDTNAKAAIDRIREARARHGGGPAE